MISPATLCLSVPQLRLPPRISPILPLSDSIINPLAPSAEYDMRYDLGLSPGDNVCFRLRSYNEMGESDMSAAVCSVI